MESEVLYTIPPQHPDAQGLALLIMAEKYQRNRLTLDEPTHVAIEKFFEAYSDDRKADLYARLAENVKATLSMVQTMAVISKCLWDNQNAQEWNNV